MKSAETGGSGPASTQVPCPLYKPLWELTEDDIAQVTREDCRRFLKEKGMRRPSWNKSQAIQQVISLKALLEPEPEADEEEEERRPQQHQHQEDEDDEDEEGEEEEEEEEEEDRGREEWRASSSSSSLPKPPGESLSSPAGSLPPPASTRDVTSGAQFPPSSHTNYPVAPYRRRDPVVAAAPAGAHRPPPPFFGPGDASTTSFRVPMAAGREALPAVLPDVASVSPRVTAAQPDPITADATQMTIFYGGRVNVYDAVTSDKAVSIMKVAASRDCPWELPSGHHQRQQIQQNQMLLHYNNSQQPFRLLRPPGTYGGADIPTAAAPAPPFPQLQLHRGQPSAPFAAAMGNADVNASVRTHPPSQNRTLDNPDWINKDMDDQPDCPTSRTASLRRYLEKRKDRKVFKYKKSVEGLSPSSMEIYMSQKFRSLVPNGVYHADFYSSTHPKPPSTPTRCSSMEKQGLNRQFSIDLNDDDVQEI